jgi:acetyltransferase-like isoleucine patch superfamily enzyme
MLKIDFSNMPVGANKLKFALKFYANIIRTWYKFNIKYPWVEYNGFVRVMTGTSFAKFNIKIGNRVQFGKDCKIAYNVHFGNNILMASRVTFVGKKDHTYDVPEQYIDQGSFGFCALHLSRAGQGWQCG